MGEQREIEDEAVDRALTRFFYSKILDALSEAEQQLNQTVITLHH